MIRSKNRNPARTNYDPETVSKSDFSTLFEGEVEREQTRFPEMDNRESRKNKVMINDPY